MQHELQIEITVHSDLDVIRDDWLELQSAGLTVLYQTFEWCNAWQEVIGRPSGVEPLVVVGRDTGGEVLFILPLAIHQHGSYRIIEWMGSDVTTYGFGVYACNFMAQSANGLDSYWPSVLAALPQVDAIWLKHLPASWRGAMHPLCNLFTTQASNKTYQIALQPNYDDLYVSKRSSGSRRGAHKRDRRLLAAGHLEFGQPQCASEAESLIDEMIAQHTKHLAARGVHNVLDDGTAAFLKQLSALRSDSDISIFPQYLQVDGRLVAAKIGFIFDRVYWAMISSLDGTNLHKFSPGDFALRKTIEACCERGLETLDFATGDSDYKHHWSDSSVTLHELIQARSARGMLWAAAKRASVEAKRVVKNSPFWWPKLARLRKATLGQKD